MPPTPCTYPQQAARHPWLALVVLMLPVTLVGIFNTILGFAIPSISRSITATGTQLLWVADIYSLVLAVLLVTAGVISDRVGRRKMLLIGSVGFGAIAIVASQVETVEMLILSLAGMGLFGAALMPSTMSLLRSVFTDRKQRQLAIAIWAAGFAGGTAIGPVVGGVLLESFSWGSVFLIAVPVLLLTVVFLPVFVPESRDPAPGRIDLLSVGLSIASLLPLVLAIKGLASGTAPWILLIYAALFVGSGYAFIHRQLRLDTPMLDLRLFKIPAFAGAVFINFQGTFGLAAFLYIASQYLQLLNGMSPIQGALSLLPGAIAMIVAGLAIVKVVQRVRVRNAVVGSLLVSVAGFALATVAVATSQPPLFIAAYLLIGAGIGASETLSNDLVLDTAPAEQAGAAAAISETAVEFGTVMGTALLGSLAYVIYRNQFTLPADAPNVAGAEESLGAALNGAANLQEPWQAIVTSAAETAFSPAILAVMGALIVVSALSTTIAARSLRGVR